jgi:carbamoylphosphate synthase large subunit
MQDGRIEVQGTVKELQEQGILEDLEVELISNKPGLSSLDDSDDGFNFDEALADAKVSDAVPTTPIGPDRAWIKAQQDGDKHRRKPRKLVEEEARQTGGVQWPIYETYLRAS